MKKRSRFIFIFLWVLLLCLVLIAVFFTNGKTSGESVKAVMNDAVLHEENKIDLFGIKAVNPAFISAMTVSGILLLFSALIRVFVISRFKIVPGKFQIILEELVGYFDNLAKTNSPSRNGFLGAYVFTAGVYIFFGTMFELLGFQAVTIKNISISLPAPLSDINAAIAMGFLSYLVIMSGGIAGNGVKGIGLTLKDFSLPFSMSFRLFGALLSGLLVNELVYYYINLSFILPVAVGLMFTLLHALIQAYVLTVLTALFYGEVTKKSNKKNLQFRRKLK